MAAAALASRQPAGVLHGNTSCHTASAILERPGFSWDMRAAAAVRGHKTSAVADFLCGVPCRHPGTGHRLCVHAVLPEWPGRRRQRQRQQPARGRHLQPALRHRQRRLAPAAQHQGDLLRLLSHYNHHTLGSRSLPRPFSVPGNGAHELRKTLNVPGRECRRERRERPV